MDDKTRGLLKKHIRMIDYIRADLVAILGENPPLANPALKEVGVEFQQPSPLYEAFEAVKVAKAADPVTNDVGAHVENCPCWGCVSQRRPDLSRVKLTSGEVAAVQAGTLNPFNPDDPRAGPPTPRAEDIPFRDKDLPDPVEAVVEPAPDEPVAWVDPPAPPVPEISEYERLKRNLHANYRQTDAMICMKNNCPPGIMCQCTQCQASK